MHDLRRVDHSRHFPTESRLSPAVAPSQHRLAPTSAPCRFATLAVLDNSSEQGGNEHVERL